VRLAYAAPAFALAVVGIPIYVYVPKFYSDVVGVPLATLGALLLAVRLFDALSDPAIGYLSDRTRSRFGRRRPWIAAGALPLAAAVVLLLAPPAALGASAAAIWFGATLFALFLFWTAVVVPYESLGAEISPDYDERTGLLALRDGLLIVGTLVAAASPALVGALVELPQGSAGERIRFGWIGAVYAPLLVLTCLVCTRVVREPRTGVVAHPGLGPGALAALLGNRPFALLLASFGVSALGSQLPATLIPFYVEYVLGDPGAERYLLLYFVVGVAFLPAWVRLARRFGKKPAWIGSMAFNTGAFLPVFLLGPGDTRAYAALVALSGVGFGATLALPSAMQADVIDYEELRSGERREGQVLGLWSVVRKLSAALGVGLALPLLDAAGYVPGAVQTPEVRRSLAALYALVPSLCNLAGLAIALAYPLGREEHRAVMAAVEARKRGEPWSDPLGPEGVRGHSPAG